MKEKDEQANPVKPKPPMEELIACARVARESRDRAKKNYDDCRQRLEELARELGRATAEYESAVADCM